MDINKDEILFNAIEHETPTVVNRLLWKGCNPNARYSIGAKLDVENISKMMTPLLKAFERNRMDLVEILLANGAQIGLTLSYVASSRKSEVIEFLLKSSAYDVDINDEKCTPLHLAVKNNCWELFQRLEAMKILLENGANVNAKDSKLNTPLRCAVLMGNIEMIKLLLEYDIDIDAVDIDGDTALHFAVVKRNAEIVEVLLQNGANVNFQDQDLRTPLCYASPKIAKLLFEYEVNVGIKSVTGNTVFESVLNGKKYEIMKMIVFHQNMYQQY